MPKVARRDLKQQSVGGAFANAKGALLPEEIAASDLAQWVMGYDALLREEDNGKYPESNSNEYSGAWRREFMEYLAESMLQTRIPFYFSSLFHIARLWKVTQAALDDCFSLRRPDYLVLSVRNLVEESSRGQSPVDEAEAYQALQAICSLGIQRHEQNLLLAKSWWGIWQSEVRQFRGTVNQFREFAGEKNGSRWRQSVAELILVTSKSSTLHGMMIDRGVSFKSEFASTQRMFSPFGNPLSLVLAFALIMSDYRYADFRHMDHILYDLLREERMVPYVQHALEVLKKKYGNTNPFSKYVVGQKAADETLLQLIKEHTLPNGANSIWLNEWEHTLSETLYTSLEFPTKGTKTTEEILEWAVKSADSVIKRNLTNERQPVESWGEFLQRIFYSEWVDYVGSMLSNANKVAEPHQAWTVEDFNMLLSELAIRLNKLGYSLKAPIVTELPKE